MSKIVTCTRTEYPSQIRNPLISLQYVTAGYGRSVVFEDLSLSLFSGEHLGVIGPNGMGKSTLLRVMQGSLRPLQGYEGNVFWYGPDGQPDASPLVAKKYIRMVSPAQQSRYVQSGWRLSGAEVIAAGMDDSLMLYGPDKDAWAPRVRVLAERADAVSLLDMHIATMSQGQLRLILLLKALISRPRLLLLDEPFEGLDAGTRQKVFSLLDQAVQAGCTLVVSAHCLEDFPPCISFVVALEHGKLKEQDGISIHFEQAKQSLSDVSDLLPVHAISAEKEPATKELPVMELHHVDVFIDRKQVLFDINWQICSGEQWVISGVNGSGKSTLLRLLYGEEFAAYGGEFLWHGLQRPALSVWRQLVGYVSDSFQDDYRYDLPGAEVVVSGLRGSVGLYEPATEEELRIAGDWLDLFQLTQYACLPLHSMSSGVARRCLLARALAGMPGLCLLDEPCSGLDPYSRQLFFRVLGQLVQQGKQLVYVSHRANDLPDFFTHALVLDQGRVVQSGPRNSLFS